VINNSLLIVKGVLHIGGSHQVIILPIETTANIGIVRSDFLERLVAEERSLLGIFDVELAHEKLLHFTGHHVLYIGGRALGKVYGFENVVLVEQFKRSRRLNNGFHFIVINEHAVVYLFSCGLISPVQFGDHKGDVNSLVLLASVGKLLLIVAGNKLLKRNLLIN
jgi:hypothetical protein